MNVLTGKRRNRKRGKKRRRRMRRRRRRTNYLSLVGVMGSGKWIK